MQPEFLKLNFLANISKVWSIFYHGCFTGCELCFKIPLSIPKFHLRARKWEKKYIISLFFASGTSNPHQLSKRKSTWGRTGLSQVSRLPCERAAIQAMAQDAKAIVLEGFVVSSLANVLEQSVVSLLDIALKGPVSLLDGSEFLLDITNPFPFDMCWRVEVQVLIELSTCDNLNDAPSNNVILLMLLLLLVTVTLTVTVTVTAANRNCERVEPYQYWN